MNREERERLARVREQAREAVQTGAVSAWISRASSGEDDPGLIPDVPQSWEHWRERDPEGFRSYLASMIGTGPAARDEDPGHGQSGELPPWLVPVALAGLALVVLAVMLARKRKRKRRPRAQRNQIPPGAARPSFYLRLDAK